jgi:hypothetical protein
MPITLQGPLAFDPGVVKRLPRLEPAMAAHELAAISIVISKIVTTPATRPIIRPLLCNYTLVSGDDHCTVTGSNDPRFCGYVGDPVLAPNAAEPEPVRKAKTLLAQFARATAPPV